MYTQFKSIYGGRKIVCINSHTKVYEYIIPNGQNFLLVHLNVFRLR